MRGSAKRQSKDILKAFGREVFDSHVRYVDSFQPLHEGTAPAKFRWRRQTLRRTAYVCILVALLFAMTLAVCSALGIQIFNFHFEQKPGHSFLIRNDDEDGQLFFQPGYTAKGYHLAEVQDLAPGTRIYSYVNDEGVYYSITEEQDADATIDINTEDCDTERIIIGDLEVRMYYWHADGSSSAYFLKDKTYFTLHGYLGRDEMISVIKSFAPDY